MKKKIVKPLEQFGPVRDCKSNQLIGESAKASAKRNPNFGGLASYGDFESVDPPFGVGQSRTSLGMMDLMSLPVGSTATNNALSCVMFWNLRGFR